MPRSRILAELRTIAVAIAALAAATAVAQQPIPRPNPASQAPLVPGNAIILGRIVEMGSNTAGPDALVTLSGTTLGSSTAIFVNGTPGGPRRILADGEGRFTFRDLPPGSYNVSASAAGFLDGSYGDVRPGNMHRPLDVTRALDLSDADRPVNILVPLWRLGGISGVVTDESGEPVAGASVSLLRQALNAGRPTTVAEIATLADDRGMYHADVAPGDYIVGLLAATTTVPATAADGFVRAQTEGGSALRTFMNEVMANGMLLPRGSGLRVRDLLVSQFGNRNAFVVPPFISENGRLLFYSSTYYPAAAQAAAAGIVTVASGEERVGIDLHLSLAAVQRISGRVVGPDGPVPNLAVRLFPNTITSLGAAPPPMIDLPSSLTDGAGTFAFLGVVPGTYTLRAMRMPRTPTDPILWAIDQVTISNDDVADLQVTLQTGARISGRVAFDGATQPAAAALRAIAITPRPAPGSRAAFQPDMPSEHPDDANQFALRQLVPGPYVMSIDNVPTGWAVKSVTTGGQDGLDRPFDLPASGVDDMVVTLTNRVSTIAGTVRAASGRLSPTATVVVFPTDTRLWGLPGMNARRVRSAPVGRDGRFAIRMLPAGEYFVAGVESLETDLSDPQILTKLMPAAARIVIDEGDLKTQDLTVIVLR